MLWLETLARVVIGCYWVNTLALERSCPGVSTDVELNRTSSLVLVGGSKLSGVVRACVVLTMPAMRKQAWRYIIMVLVLQR